MPVKRAAGGPSGSASTAQNQKRTRFEASPPGAKGSGGSGRGISAKSSTLDSDVNEDLLEEDLPEGGGRARQKAKRSIKGEEGYDSDSSDDEEGVVPSRRPGAKVEDDDVDMFADEVEEKDDKKGKGKGKEKEFMDLEDIEGQDFESKGANLDDDEENMDEESVRQKVRMSGLDGDMGIEITPFNMKDEMDEGKFTADGEEFIRNDKDPNEKHDTWLTDFDEDVIAKARKAHLERERLEKEREREEEDDKSEKEMTLMREAVDLMQRGETVLEALQRLGKEVEDKKKKDEAGQKKKSWVERQKERKALMAVEQEQTDPTHTSNPFTNLSNIVSGLTTIGHIDVYSLSRESIQRMLPAPPQEANGTRQAPAPPPSDTRMFQYRFSLAYMRGLPEGQRPVEREIFGPFSVMQLRGWKATGFFGSPACENVELRLVQDGAENGQWGSWTDIVG